MASIDVEEISFFYRLFDISKSDRFPKKETLFRNRKWNFQAFKADEFGENSGILTLDFEIELNEINGPDNSLFVTSGYVELISTGSKNLKRSIDGLIFNSQNTKYVGRFCIPENGKNEFITKDSCKFKVSFKVDAIQIGNETVLKNMLANCDCASTGHFKWHIKDKNIGKYVAICSPKFFLLGIPFRIMIGVNKVILLCESPDVMWSSSVRMQMDIVQLKIPKIFEFKFTEPYAYSEVMDGFQLVSKGNLIEFSVAIIKQIPFKADQMVMTASFNTTVCPICSEMMIERHSSSTECGHLFCEQCITCAIKTRSQCPSCNKDASIDQLRRVYLVSNYLIDCEL